MEVLYETGLNMSPDYGDVMGNGIYRKPKILCNTNPMSENLCYGKYNLKESYLYPYNS